MAKAISRARLFDRQELNVLAGVVDGFICERGTRGKVGLRDQQQLKESVRKAGVYYLQTFTDYLNQKEEWLLKSMYAAVQQGAKSISSKKLDDDWRWGAEIELARYQRGEFWKAHSDDESEITGVLIVGTAGEGGRIRSESLNGKNGTEGLDRPGTLLLWDHGEKYKIEKVRSGVLRLITMRCHEETDPRYCGGVV